MIQSQITQCVPGPGRCLDALRAARRGAGTGAGMSDLERRFGRYAVRDLSLKLVILYVVGYVLEMAAPSVFTWLTLDPWAVIHGQVWRLVSWLLIPPMTDNVFFVLIMLFFYYSIGTSLERVWGRWKYNVFIFRGILLTIVSAFVWMGVTFLLLGGAGMAAYGTGVAGYMRAYSGAFSTYYINMSIFLAYALTFPEAQVLLMFIIPVKVKYLGVLDAAFLIYEMIRYAGPSRFVIAASLLNVVILWLYSGGWMRVSPQQIHRRNSFRRAVDRGAASVGSGGRSYTGGDAIPMHKCAVCGRTSLLFPDLEFRYCSRCEGGVEYCSDHLFTHVHIRAGEKPHLFEEGQN